MPHRHSSAQTSQQILAKSPKHSLRLLYRAVCLPARKHLDVDNYNNINILIELICLVKV